MQQLNLITSSNKTIMYDQYCKMLIGHPYMLARIISCFVEEAKHLSLDEIKKLIKGVRIGDKIVNPHFHLMDKEAFIKDEGLMCYDIYFYIDLPQIVQSTKRVYINIEIQNNPYTKYHLVTRSIAYSSRMISSQWGREYDSENYDGMKKVYSFWIMPQATKSKDGCINQLKIAENHLSGNYEEKIESYDKEEQQIAEKNEVIKEYGLDDEEFKERMRDMCNLGEALELEARQEESKRKDVEHVRNIIDEFHCSLEKAMDILKLTEKERQEIMPYFQA